MRGAAVMLGGCMWLAARAALAQGPAETPAPAAAPAAPVDGAVAFAYTRADDVAGCSQADERAMRDLLQGVMRVDPFVPAGQPAPFTVAVRVTRTRTQKVRATFELLDAAGVSRGTSSVEDATCDGTHLKLAGSIALLLVPASPPGPTAPLPAAPAGDPGPGGDKGPTAPPGAPAGPAGPAVPPTAAAAPPGASPPAHTPAGSPAPGARAAPGTPPVPATPASSIVRGGRQHVCKVPLAGYCVGVDIYSLAFTAGGIMSLGFTADPGPGAWLGAELRPIENLSIGLELRGVFPSRVVADVPVDPSKPYGSPKEPDISNAEILAVPCFRYWWLMGCAVGHLGFSLAQTPAAMTSLPIVGLGPRVGIEIPFADRFFVRANGDVLFNFIETSVILYDQNLTWKQNPVSGFVGLGLGVILR